MSAITKLTQVSGKQWSFQIQARGQLFRVTIDALGDSKADAISRAGAIANKITENPILAALMPPQAKAAIKAAKYIGKIASSPEKLKAALRRLKGAGAKRLIKRLLHW